MIKASEIRNKVDKRRAELKQAEELKKKQYQINKEMLEVEKAMNKFDNNIDKDDFTAKKDFISVPIVVGEDVENILKKAGYYVVADKEDDETRLYYDMDRKLTPLNRETIDFLNKLKGSSIKIKTDLHNEDIDNECTVTKYEHFNDPLKFCITFTDSKNKSN